MSAPTNGPRNAVEAVSAAFVLFAQAYGALWQPVAGAMELWMEVVGKFPPREILFCARQHIATKSTPPTPNDIRKLCRTDAPSTCSPDGKPAPALFPKRTRWSDLDGEQRARIELWMPRWAAQLKERDPNYSDDNPL